MTSPVRDQDATLEANLENADPELCIRLLQVGLLTPGGPAGNYNTPVR